MEELLTQLKLGRIREVYRDWIDRASKEEMGYAEFLRGLLSEEICARQENRIRRKMKQASFPFPRSRRPDIRLFFAAGTETAGDSELHG